MGTQESPSVIDLVDSSSDNQVSDLEGADVPDVGEVSSGQMGQRAGAQNVNAQEGALVELKPTNDCEMGEEETWKATEDFPKSRKRAAELDSGDAAEGGADATPSEKSRKPRGATLPSGEGVAAVREDEIPPINDQMEVEDSQQEVAALAEAPALDNDDEVISLNSQDLVPAVPGIHVSKTLFIPGIVYPGVKFSNGTDTPYGYEAVGVTVDGTSQLFLRSLNDRNQLFTGLDKLLEAESSYALDNIYVSHGGADEHRSQLLAVLKVLEGPYPNNCDMTAGIQQVKVVWGDDRNNLQVLPDGFVKIQGTSGIELKFWLENRQRLPYEYVKMPIKDWEKPFGYVMSSYTDERFFQEPVIIFLQNKVADDAFCKAMGWEQIPFTVHAPGQKDGKLGYQFGYVKNDFGFIRKCRDNALIEENNVVPDGERRRRMPALLPNHGWSTPSNQVRPPFINDIESVLGGLICNDFENFKCSEYDKPIDSCRYKPDWWLDSSDMVIWVECDDPSHHNKNTRNEHIKLHMQSIAHKANSALRKNYFAIRLNPYDNNDKNYLNYPSINVLKDDIEKAIIYLKNVEVTSELSFVAGLPKLPTVCLYYKEFEKNGKYKGDFSWTKFPEGKFSRDDCYFMCE